MTARDPRVDTWVRDILKSEGRIRFSLLVEKLVDVSVLRSLARQHDVALKGYRIERASAKQLAPKLADPKLPEVIEELCRKVLERLDPEPKVEPDADPAAVASELEQKRKSLDLRSQELDSARGEVTRLRAQTARQREREARLGQELEDERVKGARGRAEIVALEGRLQRRRSGPTRPPSELEHRLHDLEREIASGAVAEEGLRRLVAVREQRIRDLEEHVAELRALLPKKKLRPERRPVEPELAAAFRLPYLSPQFYKSLEGKERRSVERGVQAVLLFCTEGPSYPGLEVKQLEGQDLWSLRASLKLRVYFRFRPDSDIEVLALADREDQHTMLRRLKER